MARPAKLRLPDDDFRQLRCLLGQLLVQLALAAGDLGLGLLDRPRRADGPAQVADDAGLRQMVERRVTGLRGGKSVLANPKLLGLWGGSSGASPLDYRWATVRRLVLDVQEGLARAGA